MNLIVGWLALVLISVVETADVNYTSIITIPSGKVRGSIVTVEGGEVAEFIGIKYGEAERFEMARPARPFQGVYDAIKVREACPQTTSNFYVSLTHTFSEDCLYLNVWRPLTNSTQPKPVMVWFHGGYYHYGTIFSRVFNANVLSKLGDVVVVSTTYRLGLLGFLYAGEDQTSPSNLGLYDKILALKWVQKNIHLFGGDPNTVTVFGESAGSTSVGLLMTSPMSKGLFHRAILQSGSPISHLSILDKETAAQYTKEIATNLTCPIEDSNQLINCLKSKDIAHIMDSTAQLFFQNKVVSPIYGDKLIPERPLDAFKRGNFRKVDLMFGNTKDEGTLFLSLWAPGLNNQTLSLNKESAGNYIRKLVPLEQEQSDAVVKYYTKNVNESDAYGLRNAIAQAYGDYYFTCPTELVGQLAFNITGKSNRYYTYRLQLRSNTYAIFRCLEWMGVCHSEDVAFLFGLPLQKPERFSANQAQLSRDMIAAWTSFARNGIITSLENATWTQAFEAPDSKIKYMALQPPHYQMRSEYYYENCQKFMRPIILDEWK